jgi:type I restriction-modification system DNA methylase subunit
MKDQKKDKIKNIFDWLQHITLYKTPSSEFTDNDWEKFNSYMVHRFVSMHVYYVEIADQTQGMLPTMKKQIYNFYKEMLPKKKVWLQHIKSKTENINKDLVEDIAKYYEVGAADARSYIAVMTKEEIPMILSEMGKDEKEIKKLLK